MAASLKNLKASPAFNARVAELFDFAVGCPKQTFPEMKSSSRLFELVVLADILEINIAEHGAGTVTVRNVTGSVLRLAGSPASADRTHFSYFELCDVPGGAVRHEAWVSVQVTTLSWERAGSVWPPPRAGRHEIDVGLFQPLITGWPSYREMHAGFSCKHLDPMKESVREALGLRRETALLARPRWSPVGWLVNAVPAFPPSPLFLVSSSSGVLAFREPIWMLGVYVMFVLFVGDGP